MERGAGTAVCVTPDGAGITVPKNGTVRCVMGMEYGVDAGVYVIGDGEIGVAVTKTITVRMVFGMIGCAVVCVMSDGAGGIVPKNGTVQCVMGMEYGVDAGVPVIGDGAVITVPKNGTFRCVMGMEYGVEAGVSVIGDGEIWIAVTK